MSKTINILGDTPKQQWLNAIMIFEECIKGNIVDSIDYFEANEDYEDCIEEKNAEQLKIAKKVAGDFADEMRRLVEGVFDD